MQEITWGARSMELEYVLVVVTGSDRFQKRFDDDLRVSRKKERKSIGNCFVDVARGALLSGTEALLSPFVIHVWTGIHLYNSIQHFEQDRYTHVKRLRENIRNQTSSRMCTWIKYRD